MALYPKAFQSLIAHFSSLPSVGPKMAERVVLYLFKQDPGKLQDFAESFEALQELKSCKRCFHIAEGELCSICQDAKREQSIICLVEEPLDVIAIERTGAYHGLYHVLGGVIESGKNETNGHLRVSELLQRVSDEGTEEVVLATNPTTEGDLTALYIKKKLEPTGVKVTRIARGLATGGDIEYADELTLSSALTNRRQI
ncbi:MAG: recombination protein RecR [Candidatus Moranbacteria bacterium RIFCSPHIGHO2_01_FULL_55_24]|nr:MAG: recombination protein RecR [Candidatus Moranbacteria bacterium RIFCSPHIGHO2_01_FULL_55_24]